MNPPLTRMALAECLKRLTNKDSGVDVMKDKDFVYYHLNRNFFNNKYGPGETEGGIVVSLTQVGNSDIFIDNLTRKWTHAGLIGSAYHMTKKELVKDVVLPRSRWLTRKFFRADDLMITAGYDGCEFELVIRNKKRLVSGADMETYNFGPYGIGSTAFGAHYRLDMAPHGVSSNYETSYYSPTNEINIIDALPSRSSNDTTPHRPFT